MEGDDSKEVSEDKDLAERKKKTSSRLPSTKTYLNVAQYSPSNFKENENERDSEENQYFKQNFFVNQLELKPNNSFFTY